MKDSISVTKFAAEVGCSARYIRDEIERGNLTGERLGVRFLVVIQDEKYKAWLANPKRGTRGKSRETHS